VSLLEFYSKPKCHLCEVAKHEIMELKQQYDFAFMEIDITQSAQLFEKYKDDIPVTMFNGEFISRYQLDREKLANHLKSSI
jgi:thiol-disulfide isomerase/thioredoxin